MLLCFTHPAGWKLLPQPLKGAPCGRGWGGEGPHGGRLSAEGSQREGIFCGQPQALVIPAALVTWVVRKVANGFLLPFLQPSATWDPLDRQVFLRVGKPLLSRNDFILNSAPAPAPAPAQ